MILRRHGVPQAPVPPDLMRTVSRRMASAGAALRIFVHIEQRRANDFVANAVAGKAGVLLCQFHRSDAPPAATAVFFAAGGERNEGLRRRLHRLGAAHTAKRAVLQRDIAIRVAGVIGQVAGDGDLWRTVAHAGRTLHVGFRALLPTGRARASCRCGWANGSAWPACSCRKARSRGHHAAHVEDVGDDGVDIVSRQALRLVPRHRAIDVIPQYRELGDFHQGRALRHVSLRSEATCPV